MALVSYRMRSLTPPIRGRLAPSSIPISICMRGKQIVSSTLMCIVPTQIKFRDLEVSKLNTDGM